MKTDFYTKAVLTVIAVCLVYSNAKDVISPALAQTPMPVNIVAVGNGAVTTFSLPVRMQ